MSISIMKQALAALEAEQALRHGYSYLGGVRVVSTADAAINALRTAIQQAEAQQLATAIACGVPGMAKTTCPYCEQGFAFEYEQPTTSEPVYQIRKAFTQDAEWAWRDATEELFHMHPKEHRRILYTHPAPSMLDGWVVVKRNAIESALQHVPYLGETWSALNAAQMQKGGK